MQRLNISFKQEQRSSQIYIGNGIRHDLAKLIFENGSLRPRRIALISNKRVSRLYGNEIKSRLKQQKLKVSEWLMAEGEQHKSFRSLEQSVKFLGDEGIERNDLVVALGGGVVGDLAGLSAAIYLRGISVVQVPTTLLAQIDSSVGGKTGINLAIGKNMVGAFHQPATVVIDTATLQTLPPRELVSGFCEMVKQGLVSDQNLFETTCDSLRLFAKNRDFLVADEFAQLISAHCAFKAAIVAADERESTDRVDTKSRRILNFGHTTAHALEAVTNYQALRHGEAVGYGMLVAAELSKNLGLLGTADLQQVREAVSLCGPLPKLNSLDEDQVLESLKHDKKSVGGRIHWVLLKGVGSPQIVDGKLIGKRLLRLSLQDGLRASGRQKERSH